MFFISQLCFKTTISQSFAEQYVLFLNTKQSLLDQISENLSHFRVFPFSSNLIVSRIE